MTLVYRVALPLLLLGLLGLWGNRGVTSLKSLKPPTDPWAAHSRAASPDTLRASAEPGTPFILTLPAELNGRSVERYSLLRGPALSGVAGRSFTWIPQGAEPGMHEVLLRGHAPDAPADTLLLRIDLSS
jgi:hypothetical protein